MASHLLERDAGSLTAGVTSTHANDSGGITARAHAVGTDVRVASCSAAATTAATGWPRSSAIR
jgi:hypothetical protein